MRQPGKRYRQSGVSAGSCSGFIATRSISIKRKSSQFHWRCSLNICSSISSCCRSVLMITLWNQVWMVRLGCTTLLIFLMAARRPRLAGSRIFTRPEFLTMNQHGLMRCVSAVRSSGGDICYLRRKSPQNREGYQYSVNGVPVRSKVRLSAYLSEAIRTSGKCWQRPKLLITGQRDFLTRPIVSRQTCWRLERAFSIRYKAELICVNRNWKTVWQSWSA